tara:strand:+ start:931 stop:1170 length:240 start_codon:yes stop_codon:yes gene_type:complete
MDGSDAISSGIAPLTGLDITGAWGLADCLMTCASGNIQGYWGSSASPARAGGPGSTMQYIWNQAYGPDPQLSSKPLAFP